MRENLFLLDWFFLIFGLILVYGTESYFWQLIGLLSAMSTIFNWIINLVKYEQKSKL
jgi:hypothetical protein